MAKFKIILEVEVLNEQIDYYCIEDYIKDKIEAEDDVRVDKSYARDIE